MRTYFLILFCLLTLTMVAQPPSTKELEEKKERLLEEIKRNEALLASQKMKEQSVLTVISAQEEKIKLQKELIKTNEQQASNLEREIQKNQKNIDQLSEELNVLKNDYAKMIEKSYKSRSERSRMMFLLSSENFTQAYKRSQYMKQYASFRKMQGEELKLKSVALQEANVVLNEQKSAKQKLIAQNEKEKQSLEKEKEIQQNLVNSIKKDQKKVIAEIKKKQKETKQIEAQIKALIRKAIAESNKKAGVKETTAGFAMTPEGKIVSKNFKANQGKLPWPVKKGTITQRFGKFPNQFAKNLMDENNDIEISTERGSVATAVFEGEVLLVEAKSPINIGVYIRHGEYVTVYKNLDKIFVKKGDKVSIGDEIGKIHTNEFTGKTTLKFFINYKIDTFLNPQVWLAK
ncbi:MAG: murein hydrolase activator EnvC family protein [Flavobacterium sp.]